MVVLMAGRINVLPAAIFLTELDRIPGDAAACISDVFLHPVAEHGSGILATVGARLDLFVDAITVRGRGVARSDVLRRIR